MIYFFDINNDFFLSRFEASRQTAVQRSIRLWFAQAYNGRSFRPLRDRKRGLDRPSNGCDGLICRLASTWQLSQRHLAVGRRNKIDAEALG